MFAGPSQGSASAATRVHSLPWWLPPARRLGVTALLLLVAGMLYFGRPGAPLLQPEDAYYAELSREMFVAGNWIEPLHRGQLYFEKPPLFFWLIQGGYTLFGIHDWAARLIPCTAAVATILVTFWWGTRMFGLRAGLAAALILCLSPRFLHQGRMIMMDGLLGLCVLSALALGQQAVHSGGMRWGFWLLSAGACGLGLLTKGPVALALVIVPLLAYQLLDQRTARVGRWRWPAYLATVMGLASPWFVAMAWRHPDFLREFFWTHHVVMRFVQPLHQEPAWFYLPVLLLGMLPWTLLVPALIRMLFRQSPPARRKRPGELGFVLLCCLWCFVFFSVADCKRIGYIVPALPTLALVLGYALDKHLPKYERQRKVHSQVVQYAPRSLVVLPFWATQLVLTAGLGCAVAAMAAKLVTPLQCAVMVTLAVAGIVWSVYGRRRQTPTRAWTGCAVATFGLLLLATHLVLPGYYRKFSVRAQVRSAASRSGPQVPVACYPHPWDSINFYLDRQDVQTYGPDDRERLIAWLPHAPETLLFVKSGAALDGLLRCLPSTVEFVATSRGEIVTAGLVRAREPAGISRQAAKPHR